MKSTLIKDPIHNSIFLEKKLFWELINTKEMQRLRRIVQLGSAQMAFPGATHSRFSHSLGTYAIAMRIMDESVDFNRLLTNREKDIVKCAALLHDIGHGPYSHSFEEITKLRHEEYSVRIITDPQTEVYKILKRHKIEPFEVASILDKSHPNKILVKVISSQVDADRMDYLLRDSYYTGTDYGNFDHSWIIQNMSIHENETTFKNKALVSLENYIVGRAHMYWAIYLHKTSLSHDFLLSSLFLRMKDLFDEGHIFNANIKPMLEWLEGGEISVKNYLLLDDYYVHELCKSFINDSDSILSDIANRIVNRKLPKVKQIQNNLDEKDVKNLLIDKYDNKYFFGIKTFNSTTYLPSESSSTENTYINIGDKNVPFEKVSPLIAAMAKNPNTITYAFYINDKN